MRTDAWRLLVVLLLGAATAAPAQESVFRSGIDLVTIDATVLTGDGRPVTNLGPADFVLKVDGQSRPVVSAQFVSQTAPASGRDAWPDTHFTSNEGASVGRYVVLAVDEAHIRRLEGRPALQAAGDFLDRLDPSDRIAVTALARVGVVEFSRDRPALKRRLEALVGDTDPVLLQFNLGLSEALEVADGSRVRLADLVLRECGQRLAAYTSPTRIADEAGGRDACPEQVEQEARAVAQHARTQARLSLSALEALVTALKGIDGQKTVVLLSEGFVADPRLIDFTELAAAAQAARVSIYVLHMEIPMFEATPDRLSPTFLQDVQLRGEGLERLAGSARGAVFRLVGSDPRPFERIAAELTGYYLLAFEPLPAERDGHFHRIEVALARGKGEVRAREAFRLSPAAPSALAREQEIVTLLRSMRLATELPVRVATYTYPEPGSAQLRVVVSMEAEAAREPASQVLLGYVLLDADGVIAASAAHRADAGRHAFSTLVREGLYALRVAAIDPLGRRGSLERPFEAQVVDRDGIRVSDLILAPVPPQPDQPLQPVVDRVNETRVVMYVELDADDGLRLRDSSVEFEVSNAPAAPSLVTVAAVGRRDARWAIARAEVPLDGLGPGRYLARAHISIAGRRLASVERPFTLGPPLPR